MNDQLKFQVALTLLQGVGPVAARNLISYCGSAEAIFREKVSHLIKIPDIGPVTAKSIVNHKVFDRAEQECEFISANKIEAFFYLDKKFPKRLTNCNDAPVLLFFKGKADLNSQRIVAIVGTRNATDYGKLITEQIVAGLGSEGVMILSGLAYGIDICAHKSAVRNNITNIGVVGHGLDRIYPSNHRSTAVKMIENGGLLTEFISGTNPDRENFPARNRIVAGMCDAVVVIESAEKGGALITADVAGSYNRDVFAVPGNINNTYSTGCNYLIKENKAALVESAADIIKMMRWVPGDEAKSTKAKQRLLFNDLDTEEEKMVNLLQENGPLHFDGISLNSSFTPGKIAKILLDLELKGIVKALPGKQFQLI
ncbi:MAG: DNA-processing protein DprA [Bacteroidota bacterium]